jgi:actin-related protein 6
LHASPIQPAIRRLSIGGRFLTNYLKDLISLRQYNVIDEFHLVNEIKEATSFVSSDFCADIEASWKGNLRSSLPRKGTVSPLLVDYVLPDYDKVARGYIRPHDSKAAGQAAKMKAQGGAGAVSEDVLPLGNERFVVPELLFRPDDLGMQEDGIPETVLQSLEALPKSLWPAMLGNVLVVGGTSLIPGFVERL